MLVRRSSIPVAATIAALLMLPANVLANGNGTLGSFLNTVVEGGGVVRKGEGRFPEAIERVAKGGSR